MKQPELGKKISDLRKQKGFTQEDLVERCNINVRTIQRIEAGEVSPRSYTLKLILGALGYDLNQMKQEFDWHEKNAIQPPKHFSKIMNLAFWIGIVFVIAISLNVFVEIMMELEPKLESKEGFGFHLSEGLYTTLQFVCAICAFFFYFGFFAAGKALKNSLLIVSSILFMVVEITNFSISGAFLYDASDSAGLYFGIISMIFYGCVGIPFGIGILKLNKHIGQYATIIGIFTIILYAMMITVILIFMVLFMWLPVMVLQLILLYKIREYVLKASNHE